ncbi:MAG: 3-methyl-2-oxobutanoate dehydrogenase subunit VorB [Dehalococcoidia bacterium]|nr:3-methyl-2-oxobutanoate dehydrogenase subunit VorB [Dehalococcoidia bacterium]
MANKVLMKGNEAIAEGAILAGCRHYFGYPITPQTEIAAYMAKKLPKIQGTFLQAESEVAAINMVIGAAAAGKRAMTSSSSPGFSLKSEGLSYLAGCDLPAVVVNVQRGGPGLGGIQPSQADYYHATKSTGHGDFHMLVLAPNSVQEMLDCAFDAFDLADKYRLTVAILSDGTLGQMMEPVDTATKESGHAIEKPWALTGTQGKRLPNLVNSLYLMPEELEATVIERYKRYALLSEKEVRCEEYFTKDADIVVVAYGITSRVAQNAIDIARKEGIKAGLLRPITLWPFPVKQLMDLAQKASVFIAAELSMGQMAGDVELAIRCQKPVLRCNRTGGMIITPEELLQKIREATTLHEQTE